MRIDSGEYSFLLEGTQVTIDYRQTGRQTRDLLIFIRFEKVVKGVWTIRVFPLSTIGGVFNMWLPMTGLLDADVSFIVSEPDTTLTMPSDAKLVITAGGYNSLNDAILLESGRGFDADGGIKPDLRSTGCGYHRGKSKRNVYSTKWHIGGCCNHCSGGGSHHGVDDSERQCFARKRSGYKKCHGKKLPQKRKN